MVGPPGAGKSMLAARLPSILPPLAPAELLEVSMVASIAGVIEGGALTNRRPFRAPHHSASMPALVGGACMRGRAKSRSPTMASCFLDELPEFSPRALDSLRQPLETGEVLIARANHRVTCPARFMLPLRPRQRPGLCMPLGRQYALHRRLPGAHLGSPDRPHRPAYRSAGGHRGRSHLAAADRRKPRGRRTRRTSPRAASRTLCRGRTAARSLQCRRLRCNPRGRGAPGLKRAVAPA
jgi:predicted ATPase with chaperone activity